MVHFLGKNPLSRNNIVKSSISIREKILAAINLEPSDQVPCSFMLFKGLLSESSSYLDFIRKQLELGLEPYAMIPPRPPVLVNDSYNLHGMPVQFHPSVRVKEWIEPRKGESTPIMVKEYHTPAGFLRAEVRQTEDWRWGNHVPIFDDYIPPRTVKYLIEDMEDLEALNYLLAPPTSAEIDALRKESEPVIQFARKHDLPVLGGWGVGADMIGWIYGLENMVYAVIDQPELIRNMLQMISEWNQARMRSLMEIGVDIYIKRAWYETCNFWSPKTFEKFLLPILREETDLAHQYGVKFGYVSTDKVPPLFPLLVDSDIDVLIGIDPHTFDLPQVKSALGGKVCLWGGVNGHLTVEMGTEKETRHEVKQAMDILSPGGGFILSPVDNVREYTERSARNVRAIIDEWRNY
jgi:hypothetical protein